MSKKASTKQATSPDGKALLLISDGGIRTVIYEYLKSLYGDDLITVHGVVPISKEGRVLENPHSLGFPKLPFAIEFSVSRTEKSVKAANSNGHFVSRSN